MVLYRQTPTPDLPTLEPGVQLLETSEGTSHILHALVADHILLAGGEACWVDTGRHARIDPLVDVAPGDRILDRVHVARGFTPFQHLALLSDLPGWTHGETALLVVPGIDEPYRDTELLADEGPEMLLAGIAVLARLAREREVPVLVTRRGRDNLGDIVANAATRRISCESTPFGPRFRTDDEETLVYPADTAGTVQTTLAFWARVLAARQPLYTASTGEVSVHGTH